MKNADRFIKLRCRSYKMVHGFDTDNREIIENVEQTEWVDKLIAVSRIQSVTQRFIRMSYSHERIIYWEYDGGLERFQKALESDAIVSEV